MAAIQAGVVESFAPTGGSSQSPAGWPFHRLPGRTPRPAPTPGSHAEPRREAIFPLTAREPPPGTREDVAAGCRVRVVVIGTIIGTVGAGFPLGVALGIADVVVPFYYDWLGAPGRDWPSCMVAATWSPPCLPGWLCALAASQARSLQWNLALNPCMPRFSQLAMVSARRFRPSWLAMNYQAYCAGLVRKIARFDLTPERLRPKCWGAAYWSWAGPPIFDCGL